RGGTCVEAILLNDCAKLISHRSFPQRFLYFRDELRCMSEFVLPDSQHDPSQRSQPCVHEFVALSVALELGSPIAFVSFWGMTALRAAVPKAAVNEDCHSLGGEDKIWRTKELPVS